jgi:NADPH:quinone reductase-like Zn-dependent oxidoreductase
MSFGGPDALQPVDIPRPEPGPGEVRIRVHAAAVNPTDAIFRSGNGQARLLGDRPPPFVPGMDAAGIIDKIGPDNTGRLSVGDRVVALILPTGPHGGAYADEIVVPSASVVHAPAGLELTAASTLPLNALTARIALDTLNLSAGQTLAVTGAAGALGGFTLQLAKTEGLRVIADSPSGNEVLVRALGAESIVPRGDDIARSIRAAVPEGVDGLIDASNQQAQVLGAIADGGALVELVGWTGPAERGITLHNIVGPSAARDTHLLERLRDQAEVGTLTLRVAGVMPANKAPEAHRRLEAGGLNGRLVLDFTT